ncbi:NAD(P)-dependent oxidoreductase [Spiroplasma endosymbiont of Atherix ibis]|uniref:NAD(P)-dependent oxidoreductase n=1 Tax=Spiroplasma endosymbiont of Atherix ibis TaxID=3066291 RepID=UPI0030D37E5F
MKVFLYGVQEIEQSIFNKANEKFNYELTFTDKLLKPETIEMAKGHDVVVLMVNCNADKKALQQFKDYGINILLTRTVGTNHIDIETLKKLEFKSGRVPSYSPNAVSDLAFSTGMALLKNIFLMYDNFKNQNFFVYPNTISKEARLSTIGILGTGRIGLETAKVWKGTGAKVLGYDPYPNKDAEDILTYVELDEILKQSDLITIHLPYIPGVNKHFINKEKIEKMKDGVILVNTSRGELFDLEAITEALRTNKIKGLSLDVVENETDLFFNKWNYNMPNSTYKALVTEFNSRVIITPHIAYFTYEAVKNMADTTFTNLHQILITGICDNSID